MKIISFAMTTDALKAGRKTVTRREWKDSHAARFKPGEIVEAWTAGPHRGGKPFGTIRIVSVTKEPTRFIPDSDWDAEGFAYMDEHGINVGAEVTCAQLWSEWRNHPTLENWVIRFAVVEIYGPGGRP